MMKPNNEQIIAEADRRWPANAPHSFDGAQFLYCINGESGRFTADRRLVIVTMDLTESLTRQQVLREVREAVVGVETFYDEVYERRGYDAIDLDRALDELEKGGEK